MYSQHGIIPTDLSDHSMIFASRKTFKVEKSKTWVTARKYKNFDLVEMPRKLVESQNYCFQFVRVDGVVRQGPLAGH